MLIDKGRLKNSVRYLSETTTDRSRTSAERRIITSTIVGSNKIQSKKNKIFLLT